MTYDKVLQEYQIKKDEVENIKQKLYNFYTEYFNNLKHKA